MLLLPSWVGVLLGEGAAGVVSGLGGGDCGEDDAAKCSGIAVERGARPWFSSLLAFSSDTKHDWDQLHLTRFPNLTKFSRSIEILDKRGAGGLRETRHTRETRDP